MTPRTAQFSVAEHDSQSEVRPISVLAQQGSVENIYANILEYHLQELKNIFTETNLSEMTMIIKVASLIWGQVSITLGISGNAFVLYATVGHDAIKLDAM